MKKAREVPETARLVTSGAYQYVLLPKEFEFEGDRVRVSKYGRGVLLEPLKPAMTSADVSKWLAGLIRETVVGGLLRGRLAQSAAIPRAPEAQGFQRLRSLAFLRRDHPRYPLQIGYDGRLIPQCRI